MFVLFVLFHYYNEIEQKEVFELNKKYEVIVIGAGNGGLAAAATTASQGIKTLVLERHNLPGGSATSFVRGRFEFESALHELCDLGTEENPGTVRKMFKTLGGDAGWYNEENAFHLVVPGKIDVVLPTGVEAFCDEMERQVPGCRDSVKAVLDYGEKALKAMAYVNSGKMNKFVMLTKYTDFLRMASISTEKGMELLGVPSKAAHIMEIYWCYLGATPDQLDFLTFACMLYKYVYGRPGLPAMKSHELSLALEKVILNHGSDIWYNSEVTKIIIENQQAKGVIVNGKEIRADHIIANVSPHTVIGKMLDKNVTVPDHVLKLANARSIAHGLETMYVGLNRSAEQLGIKDYSTLIMSDEDPKL